MLNQYAVSETSIGDSPAITTESTGDIVFNGYSLSNSSTIICTYIDYDNQGKIDLNTFNFPRDNGGGVLTKYYRGRDIKLRITLVESTASAFNTLIDNFKTALRTTEGNLDIKVNDEVRRIKATLTDIVFKKEHYNINFVNVDITFRSVEPFFYATTSQTSTFEGKTVTFDEEVTNTGSAESDPQFYFIFGATTATTVVSITAFSRTISVTNTFASGDILIVNSDTKSVTKNGVEIDYSGIFPIFSPGLCSFNVAFTGTTLADVSLILAKNYL